MLVRHTNKFFESVSRGLSANGNTPVLQAGIKGSIPLGSIPTKGVNMSDR